MKQLLRSITNWLENGDLIPAIILISVPHYASVLAKYDFWLVASVLGFLVDLSHFRTIKVYLKGGGAAWMVVLTLFSTGFHVAFYALGGAGWWSVIIGCAVPAVIFALAFISRKEKLDTKAARAVADAPTRLDAPVTRTDAPQAQVITKDAFIVAYRANGHASIAALARTMGVNARTAQKWVAGLPNEHTTEAN